jgi:hypothetical protein
MKDPLFGAQFNQSELDAPQLIRDVLPEFLVTGRHLPGVPFEYGNSICH